MRKSISVISCVALLAVGSSCTSIRNTATTASVDTQIYNLTVADLKVAPERVSKTKSWSWNPFNQINLDREKQNTTAGILSETGSDVLVEPQYEIHRRGVFRGGSITVTGYPATYSNFRTMNREDAENLAIANGNLTVTSTTAAPTVKNANDIVAGVLTGVSVSPLVKKDNKNNMPLLGRRHKDEKVRHGFLSVMGGSKVTGGIDDGCSGLVSLMYGSYGRRWGMYVKATVYWDGYEDDDKYYYEDRKCTTFYGSIGVIKTLPFGFNLMVGTGLGNCVGTDGYGSWNSEVRTELGMPIEGTLQWNYKRLNINAGVTYLASFTDFGYSANPLNLSVGIGINF